MFVDNDVYALLCNVNIDPLDNFLFFMMPPLKSISSNGSLPLFNKFSNSNAFDKADAFIKGFAVLPFHTKIIYS